MPKSILYRTSIFLYALALSEKTYCLDGDCGDYFSGFFALIMGWIGLFVEEGIYLAWLANPLLFISWLMYRKEHFIVSFLLSGTATILAAYFLAAEEILTDEAGHTSEVTGLCLGYWCWLGSICLMTVLSGWMVWEEEKK